MMTRFVLGVSFVAWTASAAPAPAPAECAGPGTICGDYETASFVFLARVSQVVPELDDLPLGPIRPQLVTFDILEDFKGTGSNATTLAFDPAAPDARIFSTGETVLAYIRPSGEKGVWSAACTRTRRVLPDDPEVAALRRLSARSGGASLEGTLTLPASARPPAVTDADPANLRITAQALDGTGTAVASLMTPGDFLFPWLRAGTYRLRIDAPEFVPIVRDVVVGDRVRCQTLPPMTLRPR